MKTFEFRVATIDDVSALAKIRGKNAEEEVYWIDRISGYLHRTHHPQQALMPRIIYLACNGDTIAGFIAGHLTTRLECEGELQWIDTVETYQRGGVASGLIRLLAKWFFSHSAYKICVDPGNEIARALYRKNGAETLDQHWMFWKDIRNIFTAESK